MTARLDVTPKTTEQNRIVRTGKFEVEVTNKKNLRSRYCTIEAMKLTILTDTKHRAASLRQQSYWFSQDFKCAITTTRLRFDRRTTQLYD